MAADQLKQSHDLRSEINVNYDQEYDEMQLDLALSYLKSEEQSSRNKKIKTFVGMVVLLLFYALLIFLITMANGRCWS